VTRSRRARDTSSGTSAAVPDRGGTRDASQLPHRMRAASAAVTVFAMMLVAAPSASAADVIVTTTRHVRLGATATFPFSTTRGDEVCLIPDPTGGCLVDVASCSFTIDGTATLTVDMGADVTLTYDRTDLVPGGSVPIDVTRSRAVAGDAGPHRCPHGRVKREAVFRVLERGRSTRRGVVGVRRW